MSHAFTKRNHYNPCFWTALWNEGYFHQYCLDSEQKQSPRDQVVYALNMRSGKVISTTVEKVHYHKNLGVAEISSESAKRFCARWHPDKYDSMVEYLDAHPESVYLDFEDILTGMESLDHYTSLMRVASLGKLQDNEDQGFIICFLMDHAMRSYEYMTASIARIEGFGIDKWEFFWRLKHAWGDKKLLARAAIVLALSEWTLWRTPCHTFPLCDSPVMINRDSVMATLSPRLLLEINLNVREPQEPWTIREDLPEQKYEEFKQRCIANTFKEIIFNDAQVLQDWLSTEQAVNRIALLRDPEKTEVSINEAALHINYGLGGFGRLPDGFEPW